MRVISGTVYLWSGPAQETWVTVCQGYDYLYCGRYLIEIFEDK